MAVLTLAQQGTVAEAMARDIAVVTYTKPTIFAALQAVENWFEANRPALSLAVNTATAPAVLPASVKQALVKYWLEEKATRE